MPIAGSIRRCCRGRKGIHAERKTTAVVAAMASRFGACAKLRDVKLPFNRR
jgi:hypothetical protein